MPMQIPSNVSAPVLGDQGRVLLRARTRPGIRPAHKNTLFDDDRCEPEPDGDAVDEFDPLQDELSDGEDDDTREDHQPEDTDPPPLPGGRTARRDRQVRTAARGHGHAPRAGRDHGHPAEWNASHSHSSRKSQFQTGPPGN